MLSMEALERQTGHSESWIQGFQDAYNSWDYADAEWDPQEYQEGWSEGKGQLCRWANRRKRGA